MPGAGSGDRVASPRQMAQRRNPVRAPYLLARDRVSGPLPAGWRSSCASGSSEAGDAKAASFALSAGASPARGLTRAVSHTSSSAWRARRTCPTPWSSASAGTAPGWARRRPWSPRASAWRPSCTRDDGRPPRWSPHRRDRCRGRCDRQMPRTRPAEAHPQRTRSRPGRRDAALQSARRDHRPGHHHTRRLGKSAFVVELVDRLRAGEFPVLAPRLERVPSTTLRERGRCLELEQSPACVLSAGAQAAGHPAVSSWIDPMQSAPCPAGVPQKPAAAARRSRWTPSGMAQWAALDRPCRASGSGSPLRMGDRRGSARTSRERAHTTTAA